MNEQLSNVIAEAIKSTKDGVVNIALFAQQQAPELAKQIVSWGFWSGLLECFIEVSASIIMWVVINKWASKAFKEDKNPLALLVMTAGSILFVAMFICFCSSMQQCVKCLVAPKLYLIEYIKELMSVPAK